MRASAGCSWALCSHFEKQLDRSQIAGLAVDLRRLGAAHRMRAVGATVHPGPLDPAVHDARVLARCYVRLIMDSARKDLGAPICRSRVQPVLQRGASLLRDFELNRTAGLALDDCRPVSHVSADGDVTTRRLTRSQPRSLLSMARLNIARSRLLCLI